MKDVAVPVMCELLDYQQDTADVFTLTLAPPLNWPGFRPGQFNMLYVPGVGESAISISGDPAKKDRLIHTIRAVGNVTQGLKQLRQGDQVGLRGPFGQSWPLDQAEGRDVLLIAGGIGLAPLRPVIYQMLRDRAAYGRVYLLYGARIPADILYTDDLLRWHGEGVLTATISVDAATPDWPGDVGIVTRYISRVEIDPANTVAMVCGPEIMMRHTAHELTAKGLPLDQVFVSMERNMKCGTAFCGHCQLGPYFVCRDGPVFNYTEVDRFMKIEQF